MLLSYVLLVLACTTLCSAESDDDTKSPPQSVSEGEVIHELLHHRGDIKYGIPKLSKPLKVFVTLYINSVTNVNEDVGAVEFVGYMSMVWTDPRLRFQYSLPFHDIQQVRLLACDIWKPDVELYDAAPPGVQGMSLLDHVVVNYNGTVRYFPSVTLPVLCDLDSLLSNDSAPFTCNLKFGSWSYHSVFMDLDYRRDLDFTMIYKAAGKWNMMDLSVQRNEVTIDPLGKTYVDITYTVTVAKRQKGGDSNLGGKEE